jgi:hypothetical protein
MAGMRDDDGFAAAEGWIDEWESGVVAYADRAEELARRLVGVRDGDGVRRVVAETVGLDSALGRAVVQEHG